MVTFGKQIGGGQMFNSKGDIEAVTTVIENYFK